MSDTLAATTATKFRVRTQKPRSSFIKLDLYVHLKLNPFKNNWLNQWIELNYQTF
ncbi:hypothetical protein SAMN05421766_102277 [Zobellia uliginosa]|uniref:Uncharacterized protein n=1 Tax=Zobellia uliginosa TaxID=143224 RepID=A0ABY1KQT0_9FLAO|nr:hypothetical protein SAMN05421766_102277 [Zobellia uliginosa]